MKRSAGHSYVGNKIRGDGNHFGDYYEWTTISKRAMTALDRLLRTEHRLKSCGTRRLQRSLCSQRVRHSNPLHRSAEPEEAAGAAASRSHCRYGREDTRADYTRHRRNGQDSSHVPPPTPIVDNDGKASNPELQAQEQGLKED